MALYSSSRGAKNEKKIQSEIIEYLNSKDIYNVKVITSNVAGTPDIIICKDSKFVALEVKKIGNHQSLRQDAQFDRIRKSSGKAFVVYGVEDVKKILESL